MVLLCSPYVSGTQDPSVFWTLGSEIHSPSFLCPGFLMTFFVFRTCNGDLRSVWDHNWINMSEKYLRECRQDKERSWSFYRYPEEMAFSVSFRAVSSSALWILDCWWELVDLGRKGTGHELWLSSYIIFHSLSSAHKPILWVTWFCRCPGSILSFFYVFCQYFTNFWLPFQLPTK